MKGIRLPDGFSCTQSELEMLGYPHTPPGAFWRDERGKWAICTPNGRIGSIEKHAVVEHEDGSITVSPSILVYPTTHTRYEGEQLVNYEAPGWHGYLQTGEWREC